MRTEKVCGVWLSGLWAMHRPSMRMEAACAWFESPAPVLIGPS